MARFRYIVHPNDYAGKMYYHKVSQTYILGSVRTSVWYSEMAADPRVPPLGEAAVPAEPLSGSVPSLAQVALLR